MEHDEGKVHQWPQGGSTIHQHALLSHVPGPGPKHQHRNMWPAQTRRTTGEGTTHSEEDVVPAYQLIVPGGAVTVVKVHLNAICAGAVQTGGEAFSVRRAYVTQVNVAATQADWQWSDMPITV